MKRLLSIFILFAALMQQANAGKVNVTMAQTAAVNFFKITATNISARTPVTATLVYTQTETDNTVDFYVFNISPTGFVIISANDQVSPVVAYSAESNFSVPSNTSSVHCWMNHAGTHIHKAIQRSVAANQTISDQWAAYAQGVRPVSAKALQQGVAPLLTTRWDQEPFYNQLCPYSAADSMRAVTGCVATAMAQIMKYWNYPAQGTGQYSYLNAPPLYFYNYGNQSANFGATTYNWQNMPDTLNSNNLAVATLMYQCGVSVAMNYGDDNQGGSGAYVLAADVSGWRHSAQMAYTNYFSYSANTIQGIYQSNYNSTDWVNLIESEIKAGRPVQYVGTDTNAGSHTWVCDGYDANDMLHMNWGWGGMDNGYYNVASLTADGYNFSNNEEALIGIEPKNNLSVTATVANTAICSGSGTIISAQGNSANANYNWTPTTGLSCATCATTTASPEVTTVYTVAMDSAGLSATTQVTVTVNNKMNLEATDVTDASCYGSLNGTAKVEISGGTGNHTYLWNNGAVSQSVSGLGAGSYQVTVTDSKGCNLTAAATISQPDSLVAFVTAANAQCNLNNAFLTVAAQGGTPEYSYVWNNGENTLSSPCLIGGVYTVTVLDAAGCSAVTSATVFQPETINVNIVSSNTTCSLLYATATANVTGGGQNFSFAWSDGSTTSSIASFSAGDISVTVTDASGCSAAASQNFTQPDSMNIHIITSNSADNILYGKAVANVTGGNPQYSYLWNTGDITPEITGLTAGIYTVTITDIRGCIQTATTNVSQTTGIENVTSSFSFNVYPNPTTTYVTLQLAGTGNEETTMQLKNMLGQTLAAHTISATETQLDLSSLANGTYLIQLTQGASTMMKEVVVQK